MPKIRQMRQYLLARAIANIYAIEDVLDDVWSGEAESEEVNTCLDECCKELEHINEKLRRLNGQQPK